MMIMNRKMCDHYDNNKTVQKNKHCHKSNKKREMSKIVRIN